MNTQGLNLFIIDDDPLMVVALRNYLGNRFGVSLTISAFYTGASALKEINKNTGIVILDYHLEGENGNDILESIKKINPKTEVIMFSSNEDVGIAIDSFRNGATDYVIKGGKSWDKITSLVYEIITYPVKLLGKEFGMNKYMVIFLLTFLVIGASVYFALKFVD